MSSPRARVATSEAIFFARPPAGFMLFVRNASANKFIRFSVAKVFFAVGSASIALRRSAGIVAAVVEPIKNLLCERCDGMLHGLLLVLVMDVMYLTYASLVFP